MGVLLIVQVANPAGGGAAATPGRSECSGMGPALLMPHMHCRRRFTGRHSTDDTPCSEMHHHPDSTF